MATICFHRRLGSDAWSECTSVVVSHGPASRDLPLCPRCLKPAQRPKPEDERLLALLDVLFEKAIREPPQTRSIGWEAVELIAEDREELDLLPRVRRLTASDDLGPLAAHDVTARPDGLVFTRTRRAQIPQRRFM